MRACFFTGEGEEFMKLNLDVPVVSPAEMMQTRSEALYAAATIWKTICLYYGREIPEVRIPKIAGAAMRLVTSFYQEKGWSISDYYQGEETVFRINVRTQEEGVSSSPAEVYFMDLKVPVIDPQALMAKLVEAQEVAQAIWQQIQEADDPSSTHQITLGKVSQGAINLVETFFATNGWQMHIVICGEKTQFSVGPAIEQTE